MSSLTIMICYSFYQYYYYCYYYKSSSQKNGIIASFYFDKKDNIIFIGVKSSTILDLFLEVVLKSDNHLIRLFSQ